MINKRKRVNKEEERIKLIIKDVIVGYGGKESDINKDNVEFLYKTCLNIIKNIQDLNEKEILEKLKESKNLDIYYTIIYFNNIIIPNFKEWK